MGHSASIFQFMDTHRQGQDGTSLISFLRLLLPTTNAETLFKSGHCKSDLFLLKEAGLLPGAIGSELAEAGLAASAQVQEHIYPHHQVQLVAHFQHQPTLNKQLVL